MDKSILRRQINTPSQCFNTRDLLPTGIESHTHNLVVILPIFYSKIQNRSILFGQKSEMTPLKSSGSADIRFEMPCCVCENNPAFHDIVTTAVLGAGPDWFGDGPCWESKGLINCPTKRCSFIISTSFLYNFSTNSCIQDIGIHSSSL